MLVIQAFRLLIEGFTVFLYFDTLYQRKRKNWQIVLFFSLAYLLLIALSPINHILINSLSTILLNTLLANLCFRCRVTSSIFQNILIFVLLCVTEFLPYMILTNIALYGPEISSLQLYVLNALFSKILFFVLSYFISHYLADRKMKINTWKQLLPLSVLPIATIFTLMAIYFLLQNQKVPLDSRSFIYNLPIIGAVLLMLANVFILVFYDRFRKSNQKLYLLQMSEEKSKLDYQYLETLKENYQQTRILIHDMKNHLLAIQSLAAQAGDSAVSAYIRDLQNSEALSYNPIFSDNEALNAVLNYEKSKCEPYKIQMRVLNEGIHLRHISDIDICRIFSNALDNAIEAADQSREKEIEVSLYCQNEAFSVISIVNSCDTPPIFVKGRPISKKADAHLHGLGLISIEATLEKYRGEVEYQYDAEQNIFQTLIVIPNST